MGGTANVPPIIFLQESGYDPFTLSFMHINPFIP
jgi:hypothetical protein